MLKLDCCLANILSIVYIKAGSFCNFVTFNIVFD